MTCSSSGSLISIDEGITYLKTGQIVAIPTETVYGLAGNATSDAVITHIYSTKNRPVFNPLIIHVDTLKRAMQYAHVSSDAITLCHHFWYPYTNSSKPLTLVLPLSNHAQRPISKLGLAGLSSIAIRCPAHPIAHYILSQLDFPLAAPSANPSEFLSPTTAEHVLKNMTVPVIDGGPCLVGIESTILDLTHETPILLRKGAVLLSDIELVLNKSVLDGTTEGSTIKAPGMTRRHYAPRLPLRINVVTPHLDEAFITFGPSPHNSPYTLSRTGDLSEAARRLFYVLDLCDNPTTYQSIAVMPIPSFGLGAAINDRLNRAAQAPLV